MDISGIIKIKHMNGRENQAADALLRVVVKDNTDMYAIGNNNASIKANNGDQRTLRRNSRIRRRCHYRK